MLSRNVEWEKELRDLVATAKDDKERTALQAFQRAVEPYFRNPKLLRTLLSKIQSEIGDKKVAVVVAEREFKSIADVQKKLPEDVRVVEL